VTADAACLNSFSGDKWDAEVYGSLSIASQISVMVKSRAQTLKLIWFLRILNKKLDNMFDGIREAMEGKRSDVPTDDLTLEQRAAKLRFSLQELHRVLSEVYRVARRAGLTNSSLTASTLNKLREHDEEIVDLIEWVELVANPVPLEELFERAEREAKTEQPLDLSKVS
jgi:hypothetical protein